MLVVALLLSIQIWIKESFILIGQQKHGGILLVATTKFSLNLIGFNYFFKLQQLVK